MLSLYSFVYMIRKGNQTMTIQIKRIYEPYEETDGIRLLVDRLWPRGISKEMAKIDEWVKELAPSSKLRIWFGHKPEKFDQFSDLYRDELDSDPDAQKRALQIILQSRTGTVTLLYGAKDTKINHAAVLKSYLEDKQQ